tara:strand:+ start:558 stop:1016 length:459 start_codon:yes stop_codon:yes gene_type:complete
MLIEALIAKPHDRVQMAVDDCLVEDIDDKERNYLYGYARKQAKRFGYEEYLPKSGSKEADPILAPALIYITQVFTSFVKAGLKEQPDLLDIMRPKKNGKGLILYTEESLINTMVASCNLWHTNAYKNKYWDGSVESMPNITIPTTEEADSKE